MQKLFYNKRAIKDKLTAGGVEKVQMDLDKFNELHIIVDYNDREGYKNQYAMGKIQFEFTIDEYGDASPTHILECNEELIAKNKHEEYNEPFPDEDKVKDYQDLIDRIIVKFYEDYEKTLLNYFELPTDFSEYIINTEEKVKEEFSHFLNKFSIYNSEYNTDESIMVYIDGEEAFEVFFDEKNQTWCVNGLMADFMEQYMWEYEESLYTAIKNAITNFKNDAKLILNVYKELK